ncbi:aldose epimerase family protein [Gracilibacillus timonensis]|uniref:aldose epimerase family protein n=1 Tax=Gracilibacillus timonensis TaxID=1816696 RepID=UPI000826FC2D|nr:aldose epimerase family protein [Gracilibacillus timonensis]
MHVETNAIDDTWKLITLKNDQNISIDILNYGARITNITVPDKDGKLENIVLSYADYKKYKNDPNYFGATVGRVAGRIANSKFELGGKTYILDANESNHHLHGGVNGLHQMIWKTQTFKTDSEVGVELQHNDSNMSGGYPGNIKITVTYKLNNDGELIIDYYAISDEDTILTLTNHSYFNLNGNLKRSINNHLVRLNSSYFVELDEELIPTGNKIKVDNTTFDFRDEQALKAGIETPQKQNQYAKNGYDHYFLLDHQKRNSVIVKEPNSGRIMTIETDQPGVVLYTGNNLDDTLELTERKSEKYLGVTFETQSSPASLEFDDFPNILLNANDPYQKRTSYKFSITDK